MINQEALLLWIGAPADAVSRIAGMFGLSEMAVVAVLCGVPFLFIALSALFRKEWISTAFFFLLAFIVFGVVRTMPPMHFATLPKSGVPMGELRAIEEAKLPVPTGPKTAAFVWKYQGKPYALNETLYDSSYRWYASLPTGVDAGGSAHDIAERANSMFIGGVSDDGTVKSLSRSLKALADKNKLTANQLVEFVAAFVETIPYDQGKADRRTSGLDGITEKIAYPYEVLYADTGVCQDKSYLAYAILRELGYGVAIFSFPDPADNHMAVGVKCPPQYANYDSGYCFLETTALGNKIGVIPSIAPSSRIAVANVDIGTVGSEVPSVAYQPLGNVDVENAIDGTVYTGIVDTINTEKELERLKGVINAGKGALTPLGTRIDTEKRKLDSMESDLKKLEQAGKYDEYNQLVGEHNDLLSATKKDIRGYNADVAAVNANVVKYSSLAKSFYR